MYVSCTVAVASLALLPETLQEEEVLSVCAVMSGVQYIDLPLTLNFTTSSEQGMHAEYNTNYTCTYYNILQMKPCLLFQVMWSPPRSSSRLVN